MNATETESHYLQFISALIRANDPFACKYIATRHDLQLVAEYAPLAGCETEKYKTIMAQWHFARMPLRFRVTRPTFFKNGSMHRYPYIGLALYNGTHSGPEGWDDPNYKHQNHVIGAALYKEIEDKIWLETRVHWTSGCNDTLIGYKFDKYNSVNMTEERWMQIECKFKEILTGMGYTLNCV